jgi:hypothetical protein
MACQDYLSGLGLSEWFIKVVRQLGTGGSDIVTMYLSTWHRPLYETENVDLICMWLWQAIEVNIIFFLRCILFSYDEHRSSSMTSFLLVYSDS